MRVVHMRKTWWGWRWWVDGGYASGVCWTFHGMVQALRLIKYRCGPKGVIHT